MRTEYDEVEVELVMEAYGVGRTRALAILRGKLKTGKVDEHGKNTGRCRKTGSADFATVDDFFGV